MPESVQVGLYAAQGLDASNDFSFQKSGLTAGEGN
jgi:hypothetical protein